MPNQKNILSPLVYLWLLLKISYLYLCRYISGLDSVPLFCLKFYNKLKSGSVSLSNVFFFTVVLAILSPLHFHINFRSSLSISTKTDAWILIGIALKLLISLCRLYSVILSNKKLYIHWNIFVNFSQQYLIFFSIYVLHNFCQIYLLFWYYCKWYYSFTFIFLFIIATTEKSLFLPIIPRNFSKRTN